MPLHKKLIAFSAVIVLLGCTPEVRTYKITVRGKQYDMKETYYPSSTSSGTTDYTLFAEDRAFTCSGSEAYCVWDLERYLDQQRSGATTDTPSSTNSPPNATTPEPRRSPPEPFENGD